MQSNKHYSPYHGIWVTILMLTGVPILLTLLVLVVLETAQPAFAQLNPPTALCLGFGMGSLYHMSCIITGLLREPFRAVTFRISEFFQNLSCSPGFAFHEYWEDIKSDGVVFIIYMTIILSCLAVALCNLSSALEMLRQLGYL